jgi:hypothetical protein
MSHHYSGPNFGFPRGDARLDLTDLYAFPKPGDPAKSILILNVHPSSAVLPLGTTTAQPFAPEAHYEIRIDTNADAVADVTYRVSVTATEGEKQSVTLRRIERVQPAAAGVEQIILAAVPVSVGVKASVAEANGHRLFVGWRSDPFFFDTLGALNDMKFTGNDFFTDKDVCSVVLEVPNTALGPGPVGLWMRVLVPDSSGNLVQVERGGRPQHAVFLAGDARDAYYAAEPEGDARFVAVFAHALEHAGGYGPDDARRAAEKLLPEILRYDPARPAEYPHNGRALIDHVTAVFLPILTNGKLRDDGVRPHGDLLADFPYLGPPHRA